MPKVTKKTTKNLKRTSTKRNDILLAVILGVAVTGVALVVTRFSSAGSNASFRRDPVTQMSGGQLVRKTKNTLVRVSNETAPGFNTITTLVSKADMVNTRMVCVEYTVLKPESRVQLEYYNGATGQAVVAPSNGTQQNSGAGVECLNTQAEAVDGTIKIHVIPGQAQITKFYGLLRYAND